MNVLHLLILHGDLCSNFAFSIIPQKSCIIQKIKKTCNVEKMFFRKT